MSASDVPSVSQHPAFEPFKANIAGDIVRKGEEGYDFGISRVSPNVALPAEYVVFPKTADDIVKAIKFARNIGVEIAICCGGHSWSGASSTRGLVIHLGKYMNSVRCDPEAKLLYVGGGALWEQVEKGAIKYGLATVAGVVNSTGVGGLALGGGYGWLSGRHGLVVDNTIQYTVVLASGEIVTANEHENMDLFWGLRGGGSNFGVVTEFVFKAHPQRPTVFFSRLYFPVDRVKDIAAAAEQWYETASDDEMLMYVYMAMPPTFEATIVCHYFFNGEAEEARRRAKIFYDLGPTEDITEDALPFELVNTLQNEPEPRSYGRIYAKGSSIPEVTPEIASFVIKMVDETTRAESNLKYNLVAFQLFKKRVISSVPTGATAFGDRTTSREMIIINHNDDPALDMRQREVVRGWATKAAEFIRVGSAPYANYEPDAERGAKVTFRDNYPRLQRVKAMYDPDGVFHKWFPIEPATF